MLFMLSPDNPTLYVFLDDDDAKELVKGNTKYIDHRMLQGFSFSGVIISQHRNKEEIVKAVRAVNPKVKIPDHIPEPPPRPGDVRCAGCACSARPESLFEDRCIVCWAAEAKKARTPGAE